MAHPAPGRQQPKKHVRISPIMLGKLGDIAAEVTHGAVIVQFAGVCARFDDCDEWHVTHAVLSNSLDVVDMDARHAHNCEVEAVVRLNGLSHIGWLRQVSNDCPLSALDIDTQGVYETHTRDAFAAMLDIADSPSGPCLFFYCLTSGGPGWRGSRFTPASHVILDTSVPYQIITGSASIPAPPATRSPLKCAVKPLATRLPLDDSNPTCRISSDSSASETGRLEMDLGQ